MKKKIYILKKEKKYYIINKQFITDLKKDKDVKNILN